MLKRQSIILLTAKTSSGSLAVQGSSDARVAGGGGACLFFTFLTYDKNSFQTVK